MARILLLLICLLLTARPIAAANLSAPIKPDREPAYSICLMAAAAGHEAPSDAVEPADHPQPGSIHHQQSDCACSMVAIPAILWPPTESVFVAPSVLQRAPVFHIDTPPHGPPRRGA